MALGSTKAAGKFLRVLLAFILAVALIPIGAFFETQPKVSALEGGDSAAAEELVSSEEVLPAAALEEAGAEESLDGDDEGVAAEPDGGSFAEKGDLPAGDESATEGELPEPSSGQAGNLADQGDGGAGEGDGFASAAGSEAQGVESPSPDPQAQAPEDASSCAVTSEVVFIVEGEGCLELSLANGDRVIVRAGEELVAKQEVGTYVGMTGIVAEGADVDAVVSVYDADQQVRLEEDARFKGGDFEKDLTFSDSSKCVKVRFEDAADEPDVADEPLALLRSRGISLFAASGGNASQPEVGDVFRGTAKVTARNIVSSGGRVADITVDPTSGILSELSSLTTYCAHHSAASPLVGFTYSYTFTVTSVNKDTGEVKGRFLATSNTSPTDGVTRDSQGRLTGYQGLEATATIWRTYTRGGISVSKTLEDGSTAGLEGVAFEIHDANGTKMSFALPDGSMADRLVLDENGRAATASNALLAGTYSVIEVASTVPDGVIPYVDAQGNGSGIVAKVNVSKQDTVYPVEVVNYRKPQLGLIKVDGDSLMSSEETGEEPLRVSGATWSLEYKTTSGWAEVERCVTDENGCVEFSDQAISRWGSYRLVELESAQADSDDGYMNFADSSGLAGVEFAVDASTWEKAAQGVFEGEPGSSWEFSVIDGKPALVHTVANWKYRDVEVRKLDEQTGASVPRTAYSLWHYLGEGEPAEAAEREESHKLYEADPRVELDPSQWELVEEGLTDENGTLLFRGLTFGYYLVIEDAPNPGYAEWWESADSSWGAYCFEVGEAEQKQVQVFENMQITLETTVDKSTIEKTSAAFRSLPDQNVDFDNVGVEHYRYDVAFTNGGTNVRADQYTVIDECEFTEMGLRLSQLWTPVVANDTDGTFNLWYRTNLTDPAVVYSTASATESNPPNSLADGSDRISTCGWKLWSEGLSAQARVPLRVADLRLAEGEYVTGLMLEYGSVEVGFATEEPLTYLVYATEQLMDDELIVNSASSHITRNWRAASVDAGTDDEAGLVEGGGFEGGVGLQDDAYDQVQTTVLDTMCFEPTESTWTGSAWGLGQTGDDTGVLAVVLGVSVLATGSFLAFRAWCRYRRSWLRD